MVAAVEKKMKITHDSKHQLFKVPKRVSRGTPQLLAQRDDKGTESFLKNLIRRFLISYCWETESRIKQDERAAESQVYIYVEADKSG